MSLRDHDSFFVGSFSLRITPGVDSPSCKEGNLVSSKPGALIILKALLGLPIDVDLLQQEPGMVSDAFDTVVEATSVRVAEGVEVECA